MIVPLQGKDEIYYSSKDRTDKVKSGIIMTDEISDEEMARGKRKLDDMLFGKRKQEKSKIIISDLGLLPEWVKESCPITWKIYNLFEKYLPFSGHLAILIATVWESMFLKGEEGKDIRPISLIIVGEGAGGKTYCTEQFKRLPNLVDIEYPTYSTFLKQYGDTQLSSQKSRSLNNKFLYLTEMAMIARTSEQTRKNLFSCWNSIMTEGKYQGALKGTTYYIGERLKPIRFGLMGVMVMEDFYERVFPITDFATRILIAFHLFQIEEALVIDEGILYEAFGDVDVSDTVYNLVPKHTERLTIDYDPHSLDMSGVKRIVGIISKTRKEAYGFRGTQDVKKLLKAHAILNKRKKVINDDIKMLRALSTLFKNPCSNTCNFQIILRSQETDDIASVLDSMKNYRVFKIHNEHIMYNENTINRCMQSLLMSNYFGVDKAKMVTKKVKDKKEAEGKRNVILNFFKDENIGDI